MTGWFAFSMLALLVCLGGLFMIDEDDPHTAAVSTLTLAAVAASIGVCLSLFVMVAGAVG